MLVPVQDLKGNKANPRTIRDGKFKKLCASLIVFPKMLSIRPIVVDGDMTILGGNMRARALQHIATLDRAGIAALIANDKTFTSLVESERQRVLDQWTAWTDKPVVKVMDASKLTDAEKQRFIIEDNAAFGEWDWEKLANEWDSEDLRDWGVDVWDTDAAFSQSDSSAAPAGDSKQQEEESPERAQEATSSNRTTISVTVHNRAEYDEVLAAIQDAVAQFDCDVR